MKFPAFSLKNIFTSDVQALSLFRILLGLFLFVDFVQAVNPDFTVFFTDRGIVPRSIDFAINSSASVISLLHMLNHPWHAFLFQAVYFIAIICFTLGYRTRLANWVLFICYVSLYNRNLMLTSGAELLIRLFLLWSLFLPLARYWSVDAALRKAPRDEPVPPILMAGIKIQVAFLYFFSGVYKLIGVPWQTGIAPAYAMMDGIYGSALGGAAAPYLMPAMPFLSYAIILFQVGFSALVYSPFWNDITRSVALVGAVLMHISFIFMLHVGGFPYLCLIYLVLVVPDRWWNALFAKRRARLEKITLYFDPACAFCEKTARLLRELCLSPHTPVLPADSDAGALALLRSHNSWVVTDAATGRTWLKWEAVAFVLRQSPVTWLFGWISGQVILARPFAVFYDFIGRSRPVLGRMTAAFLPFDDRPYAPSFAARFLCGALILLALLANVLYLPPLVKEHPVPPVLAKLIGISQVFQRWNLFAPTPTHYIYDYQVTGRDMDGKEIDLRAYFDRGKVTHMPDGRLDFENHRWLKYFSRLYEARYRKVALHALSRICKVYIPQDDGSKLKAITLVLTKKPVMAPLETETPPVVLNYETTCDG